MYSFFAVKYTNLGFCILYWYHSYIQIYSVILCDSWTLKLYMHLRMKLIIIIYAGIGQKVSSFGSDIFDISVGTKVS